MQNNTRFCPEIRFPNSHQITGKLVVNSLHISSQISYQILRNKNWLKREKDVPERTEPQRIGAENANGPKHCLLLQQQQKQMRLSQVCRHSRLC